MLGQKDRRRRWLISQGVYDNEGGDELGELSCGVWTSVHADGHGLSLFKGPSFGDGGQRIAKLGMSIKPRLHTPELGGDEHASVCTQVRRT